MLKKYFSKDDTSALITMLQEQYKIELTQEAIEPIVKQFSSRDYKSFQNALASIHKADRTIFQGSQAQEMLKKLLAVANKFSAKVLFSIIQVLDQHGKINPNYFPEFINFMNGVNAEDTKTFVSIFDFFAVTSGYKPQNLNWSRCPTPALYCVEIRGEDLRAFHDILSTHSKLYISDERVNFLRYQDAETLKIISELIQLLRESNCLNKDNLYNVLYTKKTPKIYTKEGLKVHLKLLSAFKKHDLLTQHNLGCLADLKTINRYALKFNFNTPNSNAIINFIPSIIEAPLLNQQLFKEIFEDITRTLNISSTTFLSTIRTKSTASSSLREYNNKSAFNTQEKISILHCFFEDTAFQMPMLEERLLPENPPAYEECMHHASSYSK